MAKQQLNLKDLRGLFLSPGDIYWQQKSGAQVLIAVKSDYMNIALIEKLAKANQLLFIENQINLQVKYLFGQYFKYHQNEVLLRDKIQWRQKILELFYQKLSGSESSQFEIDQLTWTVFSKVDRETAKRLLDEDIDLFKRSMSLASSFTLCAFVLGFYNDIFLSNLFTNVFIGAMDFKLSISVQVLKNQLERVRNIEKLELGDSIILETVYHLPNKENILLGERYDGQGINGLVKTEMSSLELLLVALNTHFSYIDISYKSIFYEINASTFKCEVRLLRQLKESLRIENSHGPDRKVRAAA